MRSSGWSRSASGSASPPTLLGTIPSAAPSSSASSEIEAEEALEELRSLAHGVYPSLLADRGLEEALIALGRSAPLAVSVDVTANDRYAPEIESAVYFCCLESLQNTLKHASASSMRIAISAAGGSLRFTFADDGRGFDDASVAGGAGFTNMRDRVAAVGGELRIASEPGAGTEVSGEIPLSA